MLNRVRQVLEKYNKFIILPHIHADGDALGSGTGLYKLIKILGKDALLYIEEAIPPMYSFFIPDDGGVINYKNYDQVTPSEDTVVIAVDSADIQRLGHRSQILEKASLSVNIDHHVTNTGFAHINCVIPQASATSEIIYDLCCHMGIEPDKSMAESLYTGILTDTGGFRHQNTTSHTHMVVASLLKHDINITDIYFNIYEAFTKSKILLLGMALNTLEMHLDDKIAILCTNKEMMSMSGASDDESEGIINYARNISGVHVAAYLKERENHEVKVSLRSNSTVNVAHIANKYGGGGHDKASGFTLYCSVEEAKRAVAEILKEEIMDWEDTVK